MDSKTKASMKYNRKNTTTYLIRANNKTDERLIDHMNRIDNKNGYLRGLIYADMERKNI